MKRICTLILALLLLTSLFAGCGGKPADTAPSGDPGGSAPATQAPATQAPATQAPATQAPATQAPADNGNATEAPAETEEPSPYNFAAGKYPVNADGYPAERYVYELPLCTTDEILTDWCTCYSPELIPAEGWGSMDTWAGVRTMTGVHIEYNLVSWQSRSENFSVLLASDDLDDIMQGASFYYSGSLLDAIADGYFANLYDYRDYMPCYLYECYDAAKTYSDVLPYIYLDDTHMACMYGRYDEVTPQMGFYVRQDWLDQLGLGKAEDIKTYDRITEICEAFQVAHPECWPMYMFSTIQIDNYMLMGYNTYMTSGSLSNKRVVDGAVQFCGSTDDDGEAMKLIYSWYSAGFIDPNYGSHSSTFDGGGYVANDTAGFFPNVASTIATVESSMNDPNARWEPMPMPLLTEDQMVHYGPSATGFTYGSVVVSANCENIPLAVTWLDWWFSDEGSTFTSWGPEGLLWEYDENGERKLTDFIMHHEYDSAVAMCVYASSHLTEFCLLQSRRYYAFDGGERITRAFDIWTLPNCDYSYNYPASIKLQNEARTQAATLMTDLNTFYAENVILFVDGSTPLDQWDTFQENLEQFNLADVCALWQDAYNVYKAKNG